MPYPKLPVIQRAAAELAEDLPGDWQVDPPADEGWQVGINGPAGARLLVSDPDHYEAVSRVHVSGVYPAGYSPAGHRSWDKVNVSLSRGRATIAREVERRMLSGYLELLEQAQARKAADEADRERRRALRDQLMAQLPHAYQPSQGETDRRSTVCFGSYGKDGGTVVLDKDGSSGAFEMRSVPVGLLRVVVAAVGWYCARGADGSEGAGSGPEGARAAA